MKAPRVAWSPQRSNEGLNRLVNRIVPCMTLALYVDLIEPESLDPWGRGYTDAMQRVLRLRCERTTLCDPDETDARVRAVAANLAAQPVAFPNSTRLLTEGTLTEQTRMCRSDKKDSICGNHRYRVHPLRMRGYCVPHIATTRRSNQRRIDRIAGPLSFRPRSIESNCKLNFARNRTGYRKDV